MIETYDACMHRVWKSVEKQVAALRNTRLRTSGDELKLAKLEEQYRKQEEQTCKPDKLQAARAAFYEAMKAVNKARRDRALQAASARARAETTYSKLRRSPTGEAELVARCANIAPFRLAETRDWSVQDVPKEPAPRRAFDVLRRCSQRAAVERRLLDCRTHQKWESSCNARTQGCS